MTKPPNASGPVWPRYAVPGGSYIHQPARIGFPAQDKAGIHRPDRRRSGSPGADFSSPVDCEQPHHLRAVGAHRQGRGLESPGSFEVTVGHRPCADGL